MRTFVSDNCSGLHPAVSAYLTEISQAGHAAAYGDDEITDLAQQEFRRAFGPNVKILFVPTGTGANVLGLATLLNPGDSLITTSIAHTFGDEAGAVSSQL